MNLLVDVIIVIAVKLILLIGFIAIIKYWVKKSSNNTPFIIYWIVGVPLVLYMGFSIFNWGFGVLPMPEDSLFGGDNTGPASAILGISLYLYVGLKFLKRR